jgi:ferredoxin-type protein NapG
MAGATACAGAVWLPLLASQKNINAAALRPPGAQEEDTFAALCTKCGLCVNACPYHTLKLATWADKAPMGTPYFLARQVPCEMCQDIPCVRVCPTGALDKTFPDIKQARMGIAVIDREHCLSWRGLRCEVCYRVCPVRGRAITLNIVPNEETGKHARFEPVIHSEDCTGCGKCEYACPTEKPSVFVLKQEYALGRLGKHYQPTVEDNQVVTQEIGSKTDIPEALKPKGKKQAAPGMDYFNQK